MIKGNVPSELIVYCSLAKYIENTEERTLREQAKEELVSLVSVERFMAGSDRVVASRV